MPIIEHSISDRGLASRWDSIDWNLVDQHIAVMQGRLSEASRSGDSETLAELTESFLNSFEAKAKAVANVTRNESTKNPGVGEAWTTSADKMKAVMVINHHGYRTEPFYSFVMFEPKTKKDREMCIPTFYDRAMHDLFRMLMEPICEPLYDRRLFSSRTGRSLSDAASEVQRLLSDESAPEWVVRCDVKSFYDTMSHEWLLDNIPMDRDVLEQFLKAPRVDQGRGKPMVPKAGVPTGNRMSPILANMILNGLESELHDPYDPDIGVVVRWVDDIVITARDEEDALHKMAKVRRFIDPRGLRLNEKKSYVANVREGFEFLKYRYVRIGDTIRMTPMDSAVEDLIESTREALKDKKDEMSMIKSINSHLRGFTNKYRIADMSGCSERIDRELLNMAASRIVEITGMTQKDVFDRFISVDDNGWFFRNCNGSRVRRVRDVIPVSQEPLWLTANPFVDVDYFKERLERERISHVANDRYRDIWRSTDGRCSICGMRIRRYEQTTIAKDINDSTGYVHRSCHDESITLRGRIEFMDFGPLLSPSIEQSGHIDVGDVDDATTSDDSTPVSERNFIGPIEREYGPLPSVASENVGSSVSSYDDSIDDDGNYVQGRTEVVQTSDVSVEPVGRTSQLTIVPERTKADLIPSKRGVSKYQPFVDFLVGMPYPRFRLTFTAISSHIPGGLCESAYKDRAWWFKRSRATIGEVLKVTQWSIEDVDMEKQEVFFTKNPKVKYTVAEQSFRDRRVGPEADIRVIERDERIKINKFGRLTEFLLDCGLDQIRLSFDSISNITGVRMPEFTQKKSWWAHRKKDGPLIAIEDADFTKVDLDVENRWILLARSCCVPDPSKDQIVQGDLPFKDHMRSLR